MTLLRSRSRTALTVTALAAAALYGCSSASSGGGDFTNPTGNSSGSSGSTSTGDGAAGATTDDASPGGDDASLTDDATTPDDSGNPTPHHDAGEPADATGAHPDASMPGTGVDAGSGTETDASPDESAWLDPQNAARAAVGDPPLTWNPIAAQVALNYAKLCNYEHNPNRDSDYKTLGGGNGGLGENIAAGAPTLSIAAANSGWINEKADYDYTTNTCNTMGGTIECGHYTQIVWKTTTSVGCAIVNCTTNTPFTGAGTKWTYAVCDYAPPGNLVPQGSTTPERPY